MSDIQNELRRLGQVELGDKILQYGGEWMLLKKGDKYLAHAEGHEPEFLTVRRLEVQKRRTGLTEGKVFSKERDKKLYNLHEVIKVVILDNPNPPKEKKDERKPDRAPKPKREDRSSGAERGVLSELGRIRESDERRKPEGDLVPSGEKRAVPGPSRPVPGPPRGSGRTDYSAASTRRDDGESIPGSGQADLGNRRAGRRGGDRPS